MPYETLQIETKQPKRIVAGWRRNACVYEIVGVFFPRRSLLYSLVLHGCALWGIATIPIDHPRLPGENSTRTFERTLIPDILPDALHLITKISSVVGKDLSITARKEHGQKTAGSNIGIHFAGNARIVSKFPNPANSVQTILEPGLILPPAIPSPISSPNLIKLAALASVFIPGATDAKLPSEARPASSQVPFISPDQTNAQNLVVLGVAPSPIVPKAIPVEEMRGEFSTFGPSKNATAVDDALTVGETLELESNAGVAKIPGITIQGGELEKDSWPGLSRNTKSEQSSYGLTIISSGNNGGGPGDFGVFSSEPVFTVYLDMEDSQGNALSPWILQYALAEQTLSPDDSLTPPLPVNKVLPSWPADSAEEYRGQIIVVSALIDEQGRFQHVQILQSPRAKLNAAATEALANWRFEPASVRGRAVAVKILLGISVVPEEQ